MISLDFDLLHFSFSEIHPHARMTVGFQRTLRIPDDGNFYPLPPGLGSFPQRHIDDFAPRLDPELVGRGGVVLPMYASEALWMRLGTQGVSDLPYPFALKIAAGKINCIAGEPWSAGLHAEPQDYVVIPHQPWVDGFTVAKGIIRQFVAEHLGQGHSVEEQLTGKAEFGGIQIMAYPMKVARYAALLAEHLERQRQKLRSELDALVAAIQDDVLRCQTRLQKLEAFRSRAARLLNTADTNTAAVLREMQRLRAEYNATRFENVPLDARFSEDTMAYPCMAGPVSDGAMGMAAGGRMRQEIYADPYGLDAWEQDTSSRCFVTLLPAESWRDITGEPSPTSPPTAQTYAKANLPWFDHSNPNVASVSGGGAFSKLKSWAGSKLAKGQGTPDNETIATPPETLLGPHSAGVPRLVREPHA